MAGASAKPISAVTTRYCPRERAIGLFPSRRLDACRSHGDRHRRLHRHALRDGARSVWCRARERSRSSLPAQQAASAAWQCAFVEARFHGDCFHRAARRRSPISVLRGRRMIARRELCRAQESRSAASAGRARLTAAGSYTLANVLAQTKVWRRGRRLRFEPKAWTCPRAWPPSSSGP